MSEHWWIFLRKELRDIRGNPQVLPGYLLLPVIGILLPVAFLAFSPLDPSMGRLDPDIVKLLEFATRDPQIAAYPPAERLTRFVVREFAAFLLLIPVLLSGMSAALSVAGEKQHRTLEPLLATPITDQAFVVAKLVAAVGPATLMTWGSALLYVIGVAVVTTLRLEVMVLPGVPFLVVMVVLAPLGGIVAALLGMRVSMRARDIQGAVQASSLWVVPAGIVLIAMVGRPAFRSVPLAVGAVVLFGLVAAWSFRRTVRRFEREEILTRWA